MTGGVRFPLGDVAITANASLRLATEEVVTALHRHASGDWGDLPAEDTLANELALQRQERLFSAYGSGRHRFWIIDHHRGRPLGYHRALARGLLTASCRVLSYRSPCTLSGSPPAACLFGVVSRPPSPASCQGRFPHGGSLRPFACTCAAPPSWGGFPPTPDRPHGAVCNSKQGKQL